MSKKPLTKLKQLYAFLSKSAFFPPFVVLCAILIITIWPWQNARQSVKNNHDRAVDDRVTNLTTSLNNRFTAYNNTLQSGVGLLQANPELSRDQWTTFFELTNLTTDTSGIQAIGYIKVFDQAQLQEVSDQMLSQGISDFSVHPAEPPRDSYSSLLYLYPTTDTSKGVAGLDMYTIAARKDAMDRATTTKLPALTHKLKLLQNVPTDDQYGFLIFAPFYRSGAGLSTPELRKQNLSGFVTGGFRAKRLFAQVAETQSSSGHFSLQVYDTETKAENLLYETTNTSALKKKKATQTITRKVNMYGTTWQFVFTFEGNSLLSQSERNSPLYIVLVGVITAFLVFLALFSIFKNRARELQQQKDLEVNLAKDELLSLASHQMRTPATGVKQYLGMVLQGFVGKLDKPQTELLQKAYVSNERQLHVINQILQLAKLESGRIVLAMHETNLSELLRDVIDEQQGEVKTHGHKLKQSIPKKSVIITADAHMLRMAIENLLSNAIKYTIEPGAITISLTQSRAGASIVIKDTGIGISSKQFPFIFKQFTRLYDEKAEQVSGTGIGLYLADQLIRLHKGKLRVESKPEQGSTFTISLPKNSRKRQ